MKGFFADDYESARSKFLSACAKKTSWVKAYKNDRALRDDSIELAADVVRIGPGDAPTALVLISGTHGVEGFCGSACQTAAVSLGLFDDLPSQTAVILIHAINPFGFAYLRRVTESNVDLNRNCVDDFSNQILKGFNTDYVQLDSVLNPGTWSSEKPHLGFEQIMHFIKTEGLERFQAAVSIGQYRNAKGLFYGGAEKTWSRCVLEDIISSELGCANKVMVIDYHTGLGQPGRGELICLESDGSEVFHRARHAYGTSVKATKTMDSDTKSISADVHGSIDRLFRDAREATYVALEFGTVNVLEVLEALRAENWLYHHSDNHDSDLAKQIRCDFRAAFCPENEDWRQSVVHRSAQVVTQALKALEA
jgi:hypothetical protein